MQQKLLAKRLSKVSDCDAVFRIYMHPLVNPYLSYDPMPRDQFQKVFDNLHNTGEFFILEENHQTVGFVRVFRYVGRMRHVTYIGTLAIDPEHHGKGLADKFIRDIFEEQRRTGATRIELKVESDNARAIRFYERLGFKLEGRLKNFFKRASEESFVDELCMAILL